jgi:hypothetical protein
MPVPGPPPPHPCSFLPSDDLADQESEEAQGGPESEEILFVFARAAEEGAEEAAEEEEEPEEEEQEVSPVTWLLTPHRYHFLCKGCKERRRGAVGLAGCEQATAQAEQKGRLACGGAALFFAVKELGMQLCAQV